MSSVANGPGSVRRSKRRVEGRPDCAHDRPHRGVIGPGHDQASARREERGGPRAPRKGLRRPRRRPDRRHRSRMRGKDRAPDRARDMGPAAPSGTNTGSPGVRGAPRPRAKPALCRFHGLADDARAGKGGRRTRDSPGASPGSGRSPRRPSRRAASGRRGFPGSAAEAVPCSRRAGSRASPRR